MRLRSWLRMASKSWPMEAFYHQTLPNNGTIARPEVNDDLLRRRASDARNIDALLPNLAVRCAFYLSIVGIPFLNLYIPGTGERLGVERLVQGLLILAMFSRP